VERKVEQASQKRLTQIIAFITDFNNNDDTVTALARDGHQKFQL